MPGSAEILIIAVVVILVFGAGWLPKAARNLGRAKVEMERAQQQFNDAKDTVVKTTGVKELEATINKANKTLNTSPKKLMKDAAKSAASGGAAAKDNIAEAATAEGNAAEAATAEGNTGADGAAETGARAADAAIEDAEIVEEHNITVDFDNPDS